MIKFVRRVTKTDYTDDIVIGADGGTIVAAPITPDTAIEVELDDGTIIVLLGYTRK